MVFVQIILVVALIVVSYIFNSSKNSNGRSKNEINEAPIDVTVCPHCRFSFDTLKVKKQQIDGQYGRICPHCNKNMDDVEVPETIQEMQAAKQSMPKYDDDIIRYEGD